jgi:hypothetical protein
MRSRRGAGEERGEKEDEIMKKGKEDEIMKKGKVEAGVRRTGRSMCKT